MKNLKLSGEERRRAAIIQAVRRVFAEKGFHGTTTRALAEAARVSEALLFKHFPNKEALFAAMQQSCCPEPDVSRFERLLALEPSASTLARLVDFLVRVIVVGNREEEQAIPYRLMLRSLAEDGEFARLLLRPLGECWVPRVEECYRAAVAAGDAVAGPVLPGLAGWFAYNLAALVRLQQLPNPPAVDYPVPREKLVEQAVWFVLRGMGLTEEAIRRCYPQEAP